MIGVSGKAEKDHAALGVLVHVHKNFKKFMTFEIHWLYTSLCFDHKNFKVAGGIFPCKHNVRIYLLCRIYLRFSVRVEQASRHLVSLYHVLFGIYSVEKLR